MNAYLEKEEGASGLMCKRGVELILCLNASHWARYLLQSESSINSVL